MADWPEEGRCASGSQVRVGWWEGPWSLASRHEATPPFASFVGVPGPARFAWSVVERRLDPADLEGLDAVVHLAGETIAQRWTAPARRRILQSRVHGTELVADAIARLADPPVLVSASAVGFYGDRGDELLTEQAPPGQGFLAEVCTAWEAAADSARGRTRVVHPRIGLVLARAGALQRMAQVARLGLGGSIGGGQQWVSWVALEDLARQLLWCIDEAVEGPVNAVSPRPVRQAVLAAAVADQVGRRFQLPAPGLGVRLVLGEMGTRLVVDGARVHPAVALERGFTFTHPELASALDAAL